MQQMREQKARTASDGQEPINLNERRQEQQSADAPTTTEIQEPPSRPRTIPYRETTPGAEAVRGADAENIIDQDDAELVSTFDDDPSYFVVSSAEAVPVEDPVVGELVPPKEEDTTNDVSCLRRRRTQAILLIVVVVIIVVAVLFTRASGPLPSYLYPNGRKWEPTLKVLA